MLTSRRHKVSKKEKLRNCKAAIDEKDGGKRKSLFPSVPLLYSFIEAISETACLNLLQSVARMAFVGTMFFTES